MTQILASDAFPAPEHDHDRCLEEAMVRACVDAGAVDGLTRRAEPTVDGLPLPAHIGMLELLRTMESPRGTGGPKK